MENKELQITAPEGWEIDRDKSTLDKIIFKEVKDRYPMKLLVLDTSDSFRNRLHIFGQLVTTCREWNRIDEFENKCRNEKCSLHNDGDVLTFSFFHSHFNSPIAFKYEQTAELFLSTFNKELQEVKEFL